MRHLLRALFAALLRPPKDLKDTESLLTPQEIMIPPSPAVMRGYLNATHPGRWLSEMTPLHACVLQPTTYVLQPTTCFLQPTTCVLQPTTCVLQSTTCVLQPTTCVPLPLAALVSS